jgi:hypothetical protein
MRTLLKDVISDCSRPWGYATGHKNNKLYAGDKFACGPAGINCPCCTFGNPTKVKPLSRRAFRRKAKQELNKHTNDNE